jgi:hypothetical protein
LVNLSIAFFCALEPASVRVPLPQEMPEAEEAELLAPPLDEEPLAVGPVLLDPHAASVAVAMRPAPATATYRWSFTGKSLPFEAGSVSPRGRLSGRHEPVSC